jgi:hypothetical protein
MILADIEDLVKSSTQHDKLMSITIHHGGHKRSRKSFEEEINSEIALDSKIESM